MVLVDSSVWIEAARKQGDILCKVALESLLEEYEATVCSPVKLEVLGGARPQDRQRLASGFAVLPYCEVDESVWNQALVHCWKLRDTGFSIPWNDVLIATIALQKACRVFSRDKHFDHMREVLGLRLYTPGYGGGFTPDSLT